MCHQQTAAIHISKLVAFIDPLTGSTKTAANLEIFTVLLVSYFVINDPVEQINASPTLKSHHTWGVMGKEKLCSMCKQSCQHFKKGK